MNVEPPETLVIIESIVYKSNGFAIFRKRTPVFWWEIIPNYYWGNSIQKNLSLTELEYIDRTCSWLAIDYSASPKLVKSAQIRLLYVYLTWLAMRLAR